MKKLIVGLMFGAGLLLLNAIPPSSGKTQTRSSANCWIKSTRMMT